MRPCSPPEMTLTGLFHVVAGEEQTTQRAADQRFNVATFVTAFPDIAGDPVGQVRIGLESRRVVLRVITRLGLFGPFDRAELRRHFTHQQLEQSRFTDAVFTDDGKTLAGIDRERLRLLKILRSVPS
jgi:hypothetical protein